MDVQLVQTQDEFLTLQKNWNTLLSRSQADTVFLTWEWLSSWWESYARIVDNLHIIVVYNNDGNPVGIFPLFRQRGVLLKTLRFIGDGSADSDYLDMILAKGREEEILEEAWKYLRAENNMWNVVELTGIPENSPTLPLLERLCGRERLLFHGESVPCTVANLPNSWDAYLSSLKPRFRTKVRSTLRKLHEEHNLRFYAIDKEKHLPASLEHLFDLHAKRWRLKGREGVFSNPMKRRFYERFTRRFLRCGWLAFDFLELDGRAAACQLCFRYKGTQFLLQEGFDPQFEADSVGLGLRAMVFRKAIEDGIQKYDFLAGLGRHKTQWQTSLTSCKTISMGPRSIRNTVYLRTPILLRAAKQRLKSVLPSKVLEIRRKLHAS